MGDGLLTKDGAWYSAFCIASVGMQLLNKGIALDMASAEPFDNCIMLWQNACAAALAAVMVQVSEHLPEATRSTMRMKQVRALHIRRLFLPSLNFVLMLLCSLRALRFVHIATVVVARNVCTCLIAIGEKLVFGRSVAQGAWPPIVLCMLGSVVYAYADLNFHVEGYFWQGMNSLLFTIGQLYEKWAMVNTSDQTPLGVSMIKNLWSLPIALALAILLDEPVKAVARLNASTAVLIGLSGLGCFALSITYMTLYKFSTPTSITVAANLNKVLTIIVAQSLFGGKLGQTQTVGLAICILASAWYSFATLQTSTKQK
jgi:hypothetical protein